MAPLRNISNLQILLSNASNRLYLRKSRHPTGKLDDGILISDSLSVGLRRCLARD